MLQRFSVWIGLPLVCFAQSQNPYASPQDVVQGKRIFQGHCAGCHGPGGEGGRGPTLISPTLPRAANDAALFQVIKDGIKGTEMPGAFALNEHETWQVAAFVRTLGAVVSSEKLPGNRASGERLLRSAGCLSCHSVNMQGGNMGPDLSEIGARRSAAYLRNVLLDPGSSLPEGFMQIRLSGKDGKRLTGILLNEDTYSVQIRDLSGQLHSFWKDELSQFERQRGQTPMPSYRARFSAGELDDLAAYLSSLRGPS